MVTLPKQYAWLTKEPAPRLLLAALALYGTAEKPGPGDNPSILAWAKNVGLDRVYKHDSIAWCGLFMTYATLQAGFPFHHPNSLGARNWLEFGNPAKVPMLGDVLVFSRKGGGHVGIYVGEDATAYHVLGGNQSDMVTIKRVPKARFLGARRCPWSIGQPANIRVVNLSATGALSVNEA